MSPNQNQNNDLVQKLCAAVLHGRTVEARTLAGKLYQTPRRGECRPPTMPRVLCWFDGACRNNPGGHSSYGALAKRDGKIGSGVIVWR
jgi:hypothetical protein